MDAIMKDCQTALLLASVRGHTQAVQVLIEHGVKVDGETGRGGTALMWTAGSREHVEIVQLLENAGAVHGQEY